MPLKQLLLYHTNKKWELTPEASWKMLPDDLIYLILMYYKEGLYKRMFRRVILELESVWEAFPKKRFSFLKAGIIFNSQEIGFLGQQNRLGIYDPFVI